MKHTLKQKKNTTTPQPPATGYHGESAYVNREKHLGRGRRENAKALQKDEPKFVGWGCWQSCDRRQPFEAEKCWGKKKPGIAADTENGSVFGGPVRNTQRKSMAVSCHHRRKSFMGAIKT